MFRDFFLKKGELVSLKKTEPESNFVHVTRHTDPRMVKFVLGFHQQIIPLSAVHNFAKENDFNIYAQMQSKKFSPGTIGMVLAHFLNTDDITDVTENDIQAKPILFSGFCLLIEDKCYLVPGKAVEKIIRSSHAHMEPDTTPFLKVQK